MICSNTTILPSSGHLNTLRQLRGFTEFKKTESFLNFWEVLLLWEAFIGLLKKKKIFFLKEINLNIIWKEI